MPWRVPKAPWKHKEQQHQISFQASTWLCMESLDSEPYHAREEASHTDSKAPKQIWAFLLAAMNKREKGCPRKSWGLFTKGDRTINAHEGSSHTKGHLRTCRSILGWNAGLSKWGQVCLTSCKITGWSYTLKNVLSKLLTAASLAHFRDSLSQRINMFQLFLYHHSSLARPTFTTAGLKKKIKIRSVKIWNPVVSS